MALQFGIDVNMSEHDCNYGIRRASYLNSTGSLPFKFAQAKNLLSPGRLWDPHPWRVWLKVALADCSASGGLRPP